MGYAVSKPMPAIPLSTVDVVLPNQCSDLSGRPTDRPAFARKRRTTSSTSTTSYHTAISGTLSRRSTSTTSTVPSLHATTITQSYRQPRELHHLSYLIDPEDLGEDHLGEGWKVRSPSGNLLGKTGYICRDDRPLSLRERQERIKAGLTGRTSEVSSIERSVSVGGKVNANSRRSSLGRSVSTVSSLTKRSRREIEQKKAPMEKHVDVSAEVLDFEIVEVKKKTRGRISCF